MPRVTLIYSHKNVIPKMNYSTEQPRSETVKPNLGKETNPLSVVYNPKVYQIWKKQFQTILNVNLFLKRTTKQSSIFNERNLTAKRDLQTCLLKK